MRKIDIRISEKYDTEGVLRILNQATEEVRTILATRGDSDVSITVGDIVAQEKPGTSVLDAEDVV